MTMPTLTGDAQVAAGAHGATKTYGKGEAAVHALAGVTIDFSAGAFTAIMGPSGSGKSTLMQCVAGLDRLTSGSAYIGDTDLAGLNKNELTLLRRDRLGFIFQQYNLIPSLNAKENILLPLTLAGEKADESWFDEVVRTVGLKDRLKNLPSQLSGGQQQRGRREGPGASARDRRRRRADRSPRLPYRRGNPHFHASSGGRVRSDDRDGHARSARCLLRRLRAVP